VDACLPLAVLGLYAPKQQASSVYETALTLKALAEWRAGKKGRARAEGGGRPAPQEDEFPKRVSRLSQWLAAFNANNFASGVTPIEVPGQYDRYDGSSAPTASAAFGGDCGGSGSGGGGGGGVGGGGARWGLSAQTTVRLRLPRTGAGGADGDSDGEEDEFGLGGGAGAKGDGGAFLLRERLIDKLDNRALFAELGQANSVTHLGPQHGRLPVVRGVHTGG
jgi:hypothetical protein